MENVTMENLESRNIQNLEDLSVVGTSKRNLVDLKNVIIDEDISWIPEKMSTA